MVLGRLKKYKTTFLAALFVVALLFVYLAPSILITIHPGEAGVLFRRLWGGTVLDKVYGEGLHVVAPWNIMYIYDTRLQEQKADVSVLSHNGLTIQVFTCVRFRVMYEMLPVLHQTVGPGYRDKIVIPNLISSVREIIGNYPPEELYTSARQRFQDEILVEQIEETARIPIVYHSIVVEKITLPDVINQAIEAKLSQQQEFLEYEFRLKKAEAEAQRKRIEAEGIRAYQEIISKSVTADVLKWLGIKATLELARSSNAKIVVIGNKENGLPVILNTEPGMAEVRTQADQDKKRDVPRKESPAESLIESPKEESSSSHLFENFFGGITSPEQSDKEKKSSQPMR